jgi:hypothetical protein
MGECSICAVPEVAAMVDDLLDQGVFLDDISARLALQVPPVLIHRSSIFRHKKLHYSLRLRLRAAEKKSHKPGRLLIEWPENWDSPVAGKITLSDSEFGDAPVIVAPGHLRESDMLLSVSFETQHVRNAQNQGDLKPEEPPEGEETMPEEKKDGLLVRLRKLFSQEKPEEQPAAPEPPPETLQEVQAKCQHVMSPAVDGGRCVHCGFQPPRWRPHGLSRADYVAARAARRRF